MKAAKTSVEIDREKLELAKRLTHISTQKALIDRALDALIAQARRESLVDLLGKGIWEGDLDAMRKDRGRSR